MRKKVIIISALISALIILSGLSTTICAVDIEKIQQNEAIKVEVNQYLGGTPNTIISELDYEEAQIIREILISLNTAIENNDEAAISQYEKILNDKGIFGEKYQEFLSYDAYNEKMDFAKYSRYTKFLEDRNGDNISNQLCYFNAIGQGILLTSITLRLWEAIVRAAENASSPLAGIIILLALLPFLALVVVLTNLIPFRILMAQGALTLRNGTISSLGLLGSKKVTVGPEGIDVNFSWFTGITINIPFTENSFLFVSGFALDVKETDV
ncbi:hypothetical protein AYK24_06165 [Thermoplasmatales archaeon SG8-52-4]|nr:MAG: hypothetical protein AYK24_06165 [Thermoplasmatales archaeon SG8-52-4]